MLKILLSAVLTSSLTLLSMSSMAYSDSDSDSDSDSEKGQERGERRGPPAFSVLDLDGDGSLTLAEFQEHKIPRGDHETVFNNIDSDSDGIITEDEMTSHKPPRRQRN